MIIYTDNENKCHLVNDGTMKTIETDFFDGKCKEFIEGYCCIEDDGISIYPWKDYSILEMAQQAADTAQEQADAQIMELLDVIEELIIGG